MFKNYFLITFRNLFKNKTYSFINILGLAIGMAVCILSIIFIRYELSYDSYNQNADNIYRVTSEFNNPNGYHAHFARCPDAWINNLPEDFPEVKNLIRFQWTPSVNLKIGDKLLRSFKWFFTDPEVFSVFSYNMIRGEPSTALIEPHSVVLTKEMSAKYFGNENPIGKQIILINENSGVHVPYKVTGEIENLPSNSHFQIEFLASYPNIQARQGWAWIYILLKNESNASSLEKKFPGFIKKYAGEDYASAASLHLQRLRDIHLYSNLDREIEPNGDIQYIYIFSAVALLTILIASFNFMNLSTARSVKRSKEVGVRKVLGANRKVLFNYFLWESTSLSILAFIISVLIVIIVMPFFNNLIGLSITLQAAFSLPMISAFLLLALLTGIFSGIYPAVVLSSFNPITALSKGGNLTKTKGRFNIFLRRGLVVLQFTISIVLIIFTLFSYDQFSFINNKRLGFNKDQVIAIKNVSRKDQLKYNLFKNTLRKYSGVIGVTACMDVPSRDILDAGFTRVEGIHSGDQSTVLGLQSVDSNFIKVMGIKLIAGENINNYEKGPSSDKPMSLTEMQRYINENKYSYLLNESAVKLLGWKSPEEAVGKKLEWSNALFHHSGRITGIVEDYHYASLRLKIRPLILMDEPVWQGNYLVKILPHNIKSTLNHMEQIWKQIYPDSPLQYDFLDDMFAKLYRSEEKQGQLLSIFSVFAIFIAYLGLFGLVSYTTEQRTKEIGVRKVIGASIPQIIFLLLKEFSRLIILANILAIPIGYYFVSKWLENFAYRININYEAFIYAGGLSLIIAFATVYYQTIKAASANPVESLRYE